MASKDPWSIYWQGGNLHSCIAAQATQDQAQIDGLWGDLARSMPEGAELLDLASGNGAVPRALLEANPGLSITAVDLADIAPDSLTGKFSELAKVQFLPGTDICDLPFEDARFDGVTSQFGLEYAPQAAALREAARVLKTGAPMRLLVHHSNSQIVGPAAALITELEALTSPGGLLETLMLFVNGHCELGRLEAAGQTYLDNPIGKSRHVSGQVMTGINRVIGDRQLFPERSFALASGMEQRLVAESVRLMQLRCAALDEEGACSLKAAVVDAGFGEVSIDEMSVGRDDPMLVGWSLSGLRI